MTRGPLSHLRVLDLSRVMAGPWAGQQLADLGAEVIKVERPAVGDDTRAWGPPFLTASDGSRTGQSGYFLACNRGKRSITVAIDQAEGQAIIRDLAAQSDVLLENFKVGTLARYGLGPDELLALNPRLVYCSITGFGQDGPRAHQVAYDFMIQAMGGLMSVTGEVDDAPGGGPQKVGVPIVDIMTGMYATTAVLAALARRAETGQGEVIDIAMLDVQAGFLANQAMNHLLSGETPARYGNGHPNIMPQQVFACRDGARVVLACGNDRQYQALCGVLDRPDLAQDPRYVRNAGRVQHRDELLGELARAFAAWDRTALVDALAAAAVPCGPINDIPDVFRDPQAVHRDLLIDVPHPQAGSVRLVNSPFRFRQAPIVLDRAPPALGADGDAILRQIGRSDAEIAALREREVI